MRSSSRYGSFDFGTNAARVRGLIDDIIHPEQTREILVNTLAMLQSKHASQPNRKHGNPPQ